MIASFYAFCKSKNIAIKSANTIVAVSGGVDSVVLAYLFHLAGAKFEVAHCNFGLRGPESDGDEKFVKTLANKLGVRFHVKKFETEQYAQTRGISIQMAARELRYNWFKQLKEDTGIDQVATAHHKGDTVETVLFNLTKGTGLEGLHGIKANTDMAIRPLLFATRKEILEFAENNTIKWREDSSNDSVKYSRNKIRHKVIPVLEEINPKAQEAIFSSTERLEQAEEFLNYNLDKLRKELIKVEGAHHYINTQKVMGTPGRRYVLYMLLKPFGFTYDHTNAILDGISGLPGKIYYSLTHVVNIDREQLVVSPLMENQNGLILNDQDNVYSLDDISISIKTYDAKAYRICADENILAFDKGLLKFPIRLRTWKKGDTFYPLGMKGKKKLSDFMIDAKIPVNLKNHVWLVISGDEIAGIVNHRLDDRYKITDKTKTVFELTSF